ncbi:MAG: 3' terminal RNA ribose 2'-O-methyltransferase Hen1 [Spirochaetaceae bacterium]|jgi:3' terminal RNA ribose 2'-O-methyltransferase Hen1|nr:3' terminal RNA ribose 2'-O-methyltransferase Hen1 [Spirochaetaceae bacterium]
MLFTITYGGENPTDLGYLLHKNPARPQTAELSFGRVYVFYPEIGPDRCTAALLLDIDPLDLIRSRKGVKSSGIFDYLNDRPYVCSSFMSTAISKVYGTAMAGRCAKKQELADNPLDLSAGLFMLPCRGGDMLPGLLFEPLGYEVYVEETALLDEQFREWGESPYINLTIRGNLRLRDLLNHIYTLIPVFDRQKHYWAGEDEIDKLLSHGKGWLEDHPAKALIARRYFKNFRGLAHTALDRLDNGERPSEKTARPRLNVLRLEGVLEAIKRSGAKSVIDFGCGDGSLLRLLVKEKTITRIAGVDVSRSVLERARDKLKIDQLPSARQKEIFLFQSSITYRDKRFKGYDIAALVEVIEHLDENRLDTLTAIVFGDARPGTVLISTPNIEYNKLYGISRRRHRDHRFEWSRARFESWSTEIARRYGYEVSFEGIGTADEKLGAPTQMGLFVKRDDVPRILRSTPCG